MQARNNKIVATGEAYDTKASAKAGITATKRAAAAATINDTTD